MADRPRARRNGGATIAPGASPRKSIALLAAAVALVCVALLVLFGRPPGPREPEPPPPARAAAEPSDEPAPPPPEASAAPATDPEPRARAAAPPAAEPEGGDEAEDEAESAPAVPSGIGLFPPPGTDPIKVGIVVPDDFELPEGYLRHYQVMDDGRDLEPILLFHPDYELLDAAGRPIPLPENHVVPPELAPPGLPIRMLEVPQPLDAASGDEVGR